MNSLNTNPSPREVSERVNALINGKSNATGTVTLTANSTTTVVSDALADEVCAPVLIATTANAAAEETYISARAQGSFTITHANDASTDRTFIYILMGE